MLHSNFIKRGDSKKIRIKIMNSVLKNIKTTLRQLFGFDEIEKNKEWNDYLVHQDKGYFSSKMR